MNLTGLALASQTAMTSLQSIHQTLFAFNKCFEEEPNKIIDNYIF